MTKTTVLFRTDAGPAVGLGHVRRCLALASALRELATDSTFLLDGPPDAVQMVNAAGFEASAVRSAQDVDELLDGYRRRHASALVVDSYTPPQSFMDRLSHALPRLVVIDDLGELELRAAIVVNGDAGAERLPLRCAPHTRCLFGPRYFLLNREFMALPDRPVAERVHHVLITVGGSDPHGLSVELAWSVRRALHGVGIDVVIGPFFDRERVVPQLSSIGVTVHEAPKDMPALMLAADLAISGGGQTTYELAAVGTPTVAVCLAENQGPNLDALAAAGVLVRVGDAGDADLGEKLGAALARLDPDRPAREEMSRRGKALVDGQGSARVARAIVELTER